MPDCGEGACIVFNVRAGGTRKAPAIGTRQATAPSPRTATAVPPEHDGVQRCYPEQQRLDESGGGKRYDEADGQTGGDLGRNPCVHTWRTMRLPRGAEGQPDGELAPAAEGSLGHRAEDTEANEHEPADGEARPSTCSRKRRIVTLSASTSSSTRTLLTGSSGSRPRTDSRTLARTVAVPAPPRATNVAFDGESSQYGR